MKRKLFVGVVSGMLLLGQGVAQRQGAVNVGVGRTFTISDLTGDHLGRIVASTEFQVSLTLPAEVQNVGVNAAKQGALKPTIDQSDGRVIYLDVLRAGGYATLNVRLVSQGEPLLLKLTVELSGKTSGVLNYAIKNDRAAVRATQPAPTLRPTTPAVASSVPATVPGRPTASTPTPPSKLNVPLPKAGGPTANQPIPVRVGTQPAAAAPSLKSASPMSGKTQYGNTVISIDLTKNQERSNETLAVYDYKVQLSGQLDQTKFIFMPKTLIRAGRKFIANAVQFQPNEPALIARNGLTGTLTIRKSMLDPRQNILVFVVSPVDTQTQSVLLDRHVGVSLK